jgi:nucleoside-diphosphate-sugar epimerase
MILVTGATGFLGSALVRRLVSEFTASYVVVATRRMNMVWPEGVRSVQVGDLSTTTDWSVAVRGVDVLVHCAARVHVLKENERDAKEAYRQVNVDGALNLARQAAAAGVRRFVFVSSIKVNGEQTMPGEPFSAESTPAPVDPYGVSKYEAERELLAFGNAAGIEVVIVRPPLVYGPGVRANFLSMMKWVALGIPLPLGRIHNSRSLVALDNLVDLLVVCIRHSAAAGEIFLVSDGEDVSTSELLRRTAKAMGKSTALYSVPDSWLRIIGTLMGRQKAVQRLCDSLQVDIEKTRRVLQWAPVLTLDQGLQKATSVFKNE